MIIVNLHEHPAPGAASAFEWAVRTGRGRYQRGQARGRAIRGRPRSEDDDICGMAAEAAVSLWFGHRLTDCPMAVERRRGYDVAGFQVRATSWRNGGLRLNTDDVHGRFLLAITADTQACGVVVLAGWITAEEGRQVGQWRDTGGAEPWVRVDRRHLRPLQQDAGNDRVTGLTGRGVPRT